MAYSTEADVYQATGQKTETVQKLSGKNSTQVTEMITDMIQKADRMIKNELGVPVSIRKEYHMFQYEDYLELGPHQDKLGFYDAYNPENCVEAVYAIYTSGGRIKLPFPKNCDEYTEDITHIQNGPNCSLSKESSIVKCGSNSIKAVFSASCFFYFPIEHWHKNIGPWEYIGFWARTTDRTAIFTFKLVDEFDNEISQTFQLGHNDVWELVRLRISDFVGYSTYKFDQNRLLHHVRLEVDKATTLYFDNFNFNDGLFWTYPEGLICWSVPRTVSSSGNMELYVTYSFDPYKLNTPEEINLASAKKAGILLLEFMIGCRQRITAFTQASDDLENLPDRETLEFRRAELQRQVETILAGIGFKTYSGMDEG